MKKIIIYTALMVVIIFSNSLTAFARVGDMGFFGGTSEGRRLPKTTEVLLLQSGARRPGNLTDTFIYKEMIFIDGRPTEFDGLLTVRTLGGVQDGVNVGTFTQSFVVEPNPNSDQEVSINRSISFRINYRREGNQIVKDYEVINWTESIVTPNGTYTLDPVQSHFAISIIEDHTPGVVFYKGNISKHAVFMNDSGNVIHQTIGSFYGFTNPWASTETHRINGIITTDDWQMQYQVRPSVMVTKTLQYGQNEPTAISFSGNYRETMTNTSGLRYDIFVQPLQFHDEPTSGGATITSFNTFEQLIAPDLDFLTGHWAERDIRRLFAMQVLTGEPSFFRPNQAMTRGEFTTALTRAINLPIYQPQARGANDDTIEVVFPDVTIEEEDYAYIMAAFNNGVAIGRENSHFGIHEPIQRQEVIVMMVRAIGLEHLGLDPTPMTPFVDDMYIAYWARRYLDAARRIGLITGDEQGKIHPQGYVSKAEAAAMLNRLIDYMRHGLGRDFSENIVNISN
jgi:N-acetylmuramoyl-L-alanine amidase